MNVKDALQGADGGEQRRLTDNPTGDYWPSWGASPKEQNFLFSLGRPDRPRERYTEMTTGVCAR